MKLRLRQSTTLTKAGLLLGGLALVSVLILVMVLGRVVFAKDQSGRLITVHDRGEEIAFVTDKTTLKEALEAADIAIEPQDAVEPSLDESLVATNYQVNIYRARPVTIVDGSMRQRVISPYQTAERIVKDAGVTLHSEDTTTMSRSADIIGDGAGLQVIVDRAVLVTLDLYGKTTEIRTQAETVGELLEEKKISLGESGRTSSPLSTGITSGMNLRIWREGKQTISVEETVQFGTKQIQDADQPVGYKNVQTVGKDGKRTVTYEVEIQNGQEVQRKEIASITTEEPVEQIEIIGTKPNFIPYTGGGTKSDWLAASTIPQEMWGYADFMVQKESGWNPNAVNRSSGACGLAQALPCSKLGPNWNDPVVALNWMNNYVNGRYGGWEQAYNFWVANRWY